jgi:hypothetical protein
VAAIVDLFNGEIVALIDRRTGRALRSSTTKQMSLLEKPQ